MYRFVGDGYSRGLKEDGAVEGDSRGMCFGLLQVDGSVEEKELRNEAK